MESTFDSLIKWVDFDISNEFDHLKLIVYDFLRKDKSGLDMCHFKDRTVQVFLSSFLNGKNFRLPDKVG